MVYVISVPSESCAADVSLPVPGLIPSHICLLCVRRVWRPGLWGLNVWVLGTFQEYTWLLFK